MRCLSLRKCDTAACRLWIPELQSKQVAGPAGHWKFPFPLPLPFLSKLPFPFPFLPRWIMAGLTDLLKIWCRNFLTWGGFHPVCLKHWCIQQFSLRTTMVQIKWVMHSDAACPKKIADKRSCEYTAHANMTNFLQLQSFCKKKVLPTTAWQAQSEMLCGRTFSRRRSCSSKGRRIDGYADLLSVSYEGARMAHGGWTRSCL